MGLNNGCTSLDQSSGLCEQRSGSGKSLSAELWHIPNEWAV